MPGLPELPLPPVSSVPDDQLRRWAEELVAQVRMLEGHVRWLGDRARAREEALAAELAAERARSAALAGRVEELARRLGKDSSNCSMPPSSDGPYRKPRNRSLRGRTGRRPGKQPGAPSSTLRQVADPGQVVFCPPAGCGRCGRDLSGQPVLGEQKRQVFDAVPPPPPRVTEYRVQSKACPGCGQVSQGSAPAGVTGRVQYGPLIRAATALATCAHYLPVARAAALAGALTGVPVSAGFAAAARGRAAALLAPFTDRVRELLGQASVLHADETPARAAGKLRYLHVACTGFLTALHVADRSTGGIDAGGILPGYQGVLVRDGYSGYSHLTAALHAWCGAHNLRDLRGMHQADPAGQAWAHAMAATLLDALAITRRAQAGGCAQLDSHQQRHIRARYRDAVACGIDANWARDTRLRADGLTLAMRFGSHEDMILRFITDLAIPFTNNQAERDVRPVKIAQHAAGGTWRTLLGLADFAVVRSYLSTAAKWGITPLDALNRLFTTGPWLPPAAAPP